MKQKSLKSTKKPIFQERATDKPYNELIRLQSAIDVDPLPDTATAHMERNLKRMLDKCESIGLLPADSKYDRYRLSALAPISAKNPYGLNVNSSLYSAINKLLEQNNLIGSLEGDALINWASLSAARSIKDIDPFSGGIASIFNRDIENILNKYDSSIAHLSGYSEPALPTPLFNYGHANSFEHKEHYAEPIKERPMIKKINCPEEVYTPNQNQIRDRLLDALNTYIDKQSEMLKQAIKERPLHKSEESKKRHEERIHAYENTFDEFAKIENHELLLMPEDELIQRLREIPSIRTYIYMGLQTIMMNKKQLCNDPEFIEEQRRKVAYNHNSFYLDEDTDHLLSYETMRWLEKNRNEEITNTRSDKKIEDPASAERKLGRKVKLSMEVFKTEIYPEMKMKFPDSKHVTGKKAYCTEVGKKYGVSEKTVRDKFDQCNNMGEK